MQSDPLYVSVLVILATQQEKMKLTVCFLPMSFLFVFQFYFVYNTVQVNVHFELHWECLIKDKLQYSVY